jgi:hypothetical protein
MTLHPSTSPFQQALEYVEELSPDEQWTIVELVRNRLIEHRRVEIARNATNTLLAVREGRAHYGSVDDLRRDMASEV